MKKTIVSVILFIIVILVVLFGWVFNKEEEKGAN